MAKDIKDNSMDKLFQGLTQTSPEESVPASAPEESEASLPKKKATKKKKGEIISTQVDCDKMEKIRSIAATEGLSIRDVIGVGVNMVIEKYEQLHGTVHIKRTKKGNVDEVFNK